MVADKNMPSFLNSGKYDAAHYLCVAAERPQSVIIFNIMVTE